MNRLHRSGSLGFAIGLSLLALVFSSSSHSSPPPGAPRPQSESPTSADTEKPAPRIDPRTAPTPLIEGTWRTWGPKSILGRGTDTEVTFARDGEIWTISFRHEHHPGVRPNVPPGKRKHTVTRRGPFPVEVDRGVLSYSEGEETVRVTFRVDEERLFMPAFVERSPGEWAYLNGRKSFLVQLSPSQHDAPVGTAEFPAAKNGNGFFSYEDAPSYTTDNEATKLLRLFIRKSDGSLWERDRLVFDGWGWPRHDRLRTSIYRRR